MPITAPDIDLSTIDKKLLALLCNLILDAEGAQKGASNKFGEILPISNSECAQLISLIEQYISQKTIISASNFIEMLCGAKIGNSEGIREVYLSMRKKRGRTRVMSSKHWAEFELRFGVKGGAAWRTYVEPMRFTYFLEMEEKLLRRLLVHPRIIELCMNILERNESLLQEYRDGRKALTRGAILAPIKQLLLAARGALSPQVGATPITITRVSATMLIVADISVLFTTRDWSAAGTMSAVSAAAADMLST